MARRHLQAIRTDQPKCTEIPRLIDWAAEKFPEYDRFDYFAPYAHAFEQAATTGSLRLSFAAPPQHGKSTVTLLGLLWLATFYPGLKHAYVTYSETRAEDVAKDFRRLAAHAGIVSSGTLGMVEFAGGTSIKFTSVKGPLTGYTVTGVCVIDDPIKSAKEARSATVRADTVSWYKGEARTRRHAKTSYIAMATRWHVDDLPGYLVKEQGFTYLNLKAIAEPVNDNDIAEDGRVKSDPLHRLPGEALWPQRKPPGFFREERSDKHTWYAMYQGEPQPLGGEVFRAPTEYCLSARPSTGIKSAFGVDFAYSKKTSADYSTCIEVWAVRDPKLRDYKTADNKPGPGDMIGKPVIWFYVVDVMRRQVDAPAFTLALKSKKTDRPSTRFFWYAAGTEKGAGDFVKNAGIPLTVVDPRGRDKLMRAQRTAQLWNLGRIQVPKFDDNHPDPEGDRSLDWVPVFNDEVTTFTGVTDVHDDQVDALVAAVDALLKQFATSDGPGVTGV